MIKLDTTNPMGTNGFEFLEFASPDPEAMAKTLQQLGFTAIAKHRDKDIILYRQGQINFTLNREPQSYAADFAAIHGAGCCAMGFRVQNVETALEHALKNGAELYHAIDPAAACRLAAIKGIGDTLIFLIDDYANNALYAREFMPLADVDQQPSGVGLTYIDHLTHNVHRGQMDVWYNFYQRIFNFQEIRFFDIKGQKTGLISRALTSPCGKIRIPLNEGTEESSQIEEFLREFNGEGIQHIALGTDDIYATIEAMRVKGNHFLDVPDTYYTMIDERVPQHGEDLARMQKNKILIDGNAQTEEGILLQIFTQNIFGPVFFEIIQRKGNQGFGEGNFSALFAAIERDQMQRGVL